ncbi:hypothetical protein DL96DRAFT_1574658 [Flagelloscypha sp. PMI_526]|nr:hypothetical protein DL96DRAFT_1574658 [Flagelloscypha sp. PMI_526]
MEAPRRKLTAKVSMSSQPLARSPSPFKVKAKVNSVATTPSSSVVSSRPPSPSKQRTITASPRITVAKVLPSARPLSAASGSSSPTRHRPMLSDAAYNRTRRVSLANSSPKLSPSSPDLAPPKIKSKISGVARTVSNDPLKPTPAPLAIRDRAPSIASSTSIGSSLSSTAFSSSPSSPAPQIYPITSAVPAANPHRFASVRASPPSATHHSFQPFVQPTASDDSTVNYGVNGRRRPSLASVKGMQANVDPSSVPLPPHSPPNSALSFSSRSSQDYDSSNSSVHINGSITHTRTRTSLGGTGMNALGLHEPSAESQSFPVDQEQRKEKVEAKTNRKIADLEITNTSLLAINASMERTKNKQAKEIRELRRKLRESRLSLPPRIYQEQVKDQAGQESEESDEEAEDGEEEPITNPKPGEKETKLDATYRRVKLLLDDLLVSGRKALETTPDDFADAKPKGTKVLNLDEVVLWQEGRDGDAGDISLQLSDLGDESDEETNRDMSLDDATLTVARDASLSADEAEVEALVRHSSTPPRSPTPPGILVTQPP